MLKTVSKDVVKYIPKSEEGSDKPTIVCFKRMSKGQYDVFMNSLTEMKGRKVISKMGEASKKLFEICLSPDEKGVYIYNVIDEGKEVPQITVLAEAVNFLLSLGDLNVANEIEAQMRGQSTLSEDEEKN
jgi:hypothetical protein